MSRACCSLALTAASCPCEGSWRRVRSHAAASKAWREWGFVWLEICSAHKPRRAGARGWEGWVGRVLWPHLQHSQP